MQKRKFDYILPFAGITLARFYGFDLSRRPLSETPRETCSYQAVGLYSRCKVRKKQKITVALQHIAK
jgi:hypothetical protein